MSETEIERQLRRFNFYKGGIEKKSPFLKDYINKNILKNGIYVKINKGISGTDFSALLAKFQRSIATQIYLYKKKREENDFNYIPRQPDLPLTDDNLNNHNQTTSQSYSQPYQQAYTPSIAPSHTPSMMSNMEVNTILARRELKAQKDKLKQDRIKFKDEMEIREEALLVILEERESNFKIQQEVFYANLEAKQRLLNKELENVELEKKELKNKIEGVNDFKIKLMSIAITEKSKSLLNDSHYVMAQLDKNS